ncbi:MAG: TlpA family protein disulfide reductase [Actinomycetota bacterium]|nr:TlpA family protein disulfide reductase [Actinomycetota bacterium]
MSRKSNDVRRTARVAALAALLLTVLVAAGCGGPGDASPASAGGGGGGTESSAASGATSATIETLNGEQFDLADKRGEVVALYFMAGWCGSCIPEAQAWSKLYPAYEDEGLEVLMVSADPNDTPRTIESFRRAGGIGELPWAVDGTGDFTRTLGVRALDSTVILDRKGKVAYRDAVPTDAETLEKELKEVL